MQSAKSAPQVIQKENKRQVSSSKYVKLAQLNNIFKIKIFFIVGRPQQKLMWKININKPSRFPLEGVGVEIIWALRIFLLAGWGNFGEVARWTEEISAAV